MISESQLQKFVNFLFKKHCKTEEDVKMKFIVPFFEELGHNRLFFEARKSDFIIQYEDSDFSILVEAKRCDKRLEEKHVAQLAGYCRKHKPSLAVLSNGKETWVFDPSWAERQSFKDKRILAIKFTDLIKNREILANLLSYEALVTGKFLATLKDYKLRHVDRVEMLDYVNYYGLIQGKQIMFCSTRVRSTNLFLMCKKDRHSDKHELSSEGKECLEILPNFKYSQYIAEVEIMPLKKNKLEMWKKLHQAKLFAFWDPKEGPCAYNRTLKSIALCRVYKIPISIAYDDIGDGQSCRRIINRSKIQQISGATTNRRSILNDLKYNDIYHQIRQIINKYTR